MARTKKNNSQTNAKPMEWLANSNSKADNSSSGDEQMRVECDDNTITDMSVNTIENSEHTVTECVNQCVSGVAIIHFIECQISGTNVSRQPSLMQNAFLSMKARKFNPQWIACDEVMAMQCFDGFMFVCDAFDGQIFEFLMERNARIIGPLCVLYCSTESRVRYDNIPTKMCPIFSQCMRKLTVSISSFEGQRRTDIIQKIERMGANFVKDLTRTVTHLVSDSVRTAKYKVASRLGKTVLTSEWVDICWQKYQYELFDANDKDITDKYKVPIFKNLLVSLSQLEQNEKDKIQELVEQNGGTYSAPLKLTVDNTILVLKEPNGDKYKYARMRRIPCLSVQWIFDSIENGYAMPEENYAILPNVSPKSQEKGFSTEKLRAVSAQKPSQITNESAAINSQTKTNEDIEMLSDKTLSVKTDSTSSSVPKTSQFDSSKEIIDSIKALSSNENDEHFLEGCILHIIGFDRSVIDAAKRAASSRGSLVLERFTSQTTHVIVGPNSTKFDVDSLRTKSSQTDSMCKFVNIDWIFDSFRYKELCDHNAYEINESSFKENKTMSQDSLKMPSNFELPETSKKALEKLRKTSEINKSRVHKSLVNTVNDDTPIQWNDASSETSIPSQKPYSRVNSSADSAQEINLNENKRESDVHNNDNLNINNDEINNNTDKIVSNRNNELKSIAANDVDVATEVYVVENRSAVNEVIVEEERGSRSSQATLTAPVVPKVFMFSGYDDQIKAEFIEIVKNLNASVIESERVVQTVTHLIVKNPSATEKVLSAIALGIWILRDDYLSESNKRREFVCEEEYEWGTYMGNSGVSKSDQRSVRKNLMLSATEWRKHLKNECKTGAFDNWKVLILNQTNQIRSYAQILKCGNASVFYSCSELTCDQLSRFNYCFVDSFDYNSVSNINVMKELVRQQKLHKIDFISHYLITGPITATSPGFSSKLLVKDLTNSSNSREQRKRASNRIEGSGRHTKVRKQIQ